jgi:hypothetical protein
VSQPAKGSAFVTSTLSNAEQSNSDEDKEFRLGTRLLLDRTTAYSRRRTSRRFYWRSRGELPVRSAPTVRPAVRHSRKLVESRAKVPVYDLCHAQPRDLVAVAHGWVRHVRLNRFTWPDAVNFEGTVRVPAMVRWPGHTQPARSRPGCFLASTGSGLKGRAAPRSGGGRNGYLAAAARGVAGRGDPAHDTHSVTHPARPFVTAGEGEVDPFEPITAGRAAGFEQGQLHIPPARLF